MPPKIALSLFLAFILYALWKDIKESRGTSACLWVPFMWIAISASKPITFWLYPRLSPRYDGTIGAISFDGTALERIPLIIMMVLGLIILYTRRNKFFIDFKKNSWLWLFFFYMLISISWSGYQGSSLKRWIRAIGDIIMILVILTEDNEREAVECLIRRCAIILIPLSILFIKYYRYIGVTFDRALGSVMYIGVTRHKNHLGQLCAFVGIFFLWRIMKTWPKIDLLDTFLLVLTLYLLHLADSITSIVVFLVGLIILIFDRLLKSDLRRINRAVFGLIACLVIVQVFLVGFASDSLLTHFFSATNRDQSLTDRIPLWKDLIQRANSQQITGAGFGGFWNPDMITVLWSKYQWGPVAAHNGYIDIFLDLGILGLAIFFFVAFKGLRRILNSSENENKLRTFQFVFLIMILLHNFAESTLLKTASFLWQLFLLITITIERKRILVEAQGPQDVI